MGGESNVTQTAGPATASVPSGLGGVITVIEGIWAGLTDGKLWRSLGWLLLGVVLILFGLSAWIGPKLGEAGVPPVLPA